MLFLRQLIIIILNNIEHFKFYLYQLQQFIISFSGHFALLLLWIREYNRIFAMSIKGLKITSNQIRYVFPTQIQPNKQFLKVQQLKKKLKLKFRQIMLNILPNFPYRIKYSAGCIIFQCCFCPSNLQYKLNRERGIYQLTVFSVDHTHGINFDHQEIKTKKIAQVYSINDENIEQIIKDKINQLEEPMAGHFQRKQPIKFKQPKNFQQLLKNLKQLNFFVSYEPENLQESKLQYPDFLIIISEQMKRTYLNHARSVGFDFTYSLIRQTPLTYYGKRQYIIGVIAGLNSYRRIAIFALVIATEESSHYVQKTFTQFIKYMGKEPKSIVTDQSWGMLSGMKEIKRKGVYHGESFWDTFHVLKTYKFRNKILKSHMRMMIREKCKYQFHKMYLQAVRMARTEEEMDAIHQFMHQSQKYCISQIPPHFVGLGVSDSHNQALNGLIKNIIPHQAKYIKVIPTILDFIEERNSLAQMIARETCKVDEVVNNNQLQIVRYSLCRNVYAFFFVQICRSCKVDLIYRNLSNDLFCVQDSNTIHYINKVPIEECSHLVQDVRFTHIRDAFKCTCQFQQKTGIPCEHILKVIFQTDNNFIDRLDQYWVIDEPQKLYKCITNLGEQNQQAIKKRGRPFGKPTLFFKPETQQNIKLPKGVSTFQPLKPRVKSEANIQNSNVVQLNRQHLVESNDEDNNENKQQFKTSRMQIMKKFYSKKQQA